MEKHELMNGLVRVREANHDSVGMVELEIEIQQPIRGILENGYPAIRKGEGKNARLCDERTCFVFVVLVVLVCRLLSQLFVLCGVVLSSNFKI